MREFVTKVSDYLNERRNNPEKQEDRIAAVIIGAVAVVVIVLLLLILWGHMSRERADKEARTESALTATTYEEHASEYMAQNDGQEALRQEYLTSIEYLSNKVEELLTALTQVEQNLSETVEQYQEGDSTLSQEITSLHKQITNIVQNLHKAQTELYDLIDIVQVMNEEKIPMIQSQIIQIREEVNRVNADITNLHADVSDLYTKIDALKQEDVKLWESIRNVEQALQTALDQNMAEVNNQFDIVLNQIETMESRISQLTGQMLQYRYDERDHTLYLEPYEE